MGVLHTKNKAFAYRKFYHHIRAENVDMIIEMKFSNTNQLRGALDDYRILRGYDIKMLHSDKRRFQAKCMRSRCKWKM